MSDQPEAAQMPDPYDGLSPYGIAITALERILELDTGWMSWDQARGIASEAHGLAIAVAAYATEKSGRAIPGLRDLVADWRKTADSLKDRHGIGDARERNTLNVLISQAEAILAEPQPKQAAPELPAQPPSPEPDGTITIGPKCFASSDRRVISWRGVNYYPWASDPDHQVLHDACEADIASITDQRNRCSDTADQLRAVVRELISMFRGIPGGYGARTSIGRLNRLAKEAGVDPVLPGPPLSAVVADELGALRESIATVASGLEQRANTNRPSKVTEICDNIAASLRGILEPSS